MLEQRWHFESVVGLESSERTYQSDEHIALRVACFDDVRFFLSKNDEFCIKNKAICIKTRNCVSKTTNFVLKMMNFAVHTA